MHGLPQYRKLLVTSGDDRGRRTRDHGARSDHLGRDLSPGGREPAQKRAYLDVRYLAGYQVPAAEKLLTLQGRSSKETMLGLLPCALLSGDVPRKGGDRYA